MFDNAALFFYDHAPAGTLVLLSLLAVLALAVAGGLLWSLRRI